MIIVSGKIYVVEDRREEFLTASLDAMASARRTPGCQDFVVAADPLEPDRVNVYEQWESEQALLAFRGEGPSSELTAVIVRAEVRQHNVNES
jgi:quinol monooxygenase YgiN